MYMLFQDHLDMHNEIMNMAQLPYVAQSGRFTLLGPKVAYVWLNMQYKDGHSSMYLLIYSCSGWP